MNSLAPSGLYKTSYEQSDVQTGVVHLGFGAFHRAHQALYIDDYMEKSGDLSWGIAAINLRAEDSENFAKNTVCPRGYIAKIMSPDGTSTYRSVRSHNMFVDWQTDRSAVEQLFALGSVKAVTMTITESGYYVDANRVLNVEDPVILADASGRGQTSIYRLLQTGLQTRKDAGGSGLTILCCDNIRQNGKMLRANFQRYLALAGADDLRVWVNQNVTFPCSMVDRITPRSPDALLEEIAQTFWPASINPVMAEDFSQWVIEDNFANVMPDLETVGVTVTGDVEPYEESKIRILNGGHTCLAYLAALSGYHSFDQAMNDPELFAHFSSFVKGEVLPALTLELPFDKENYLQKIISRFRNASIGDTVERICADGYLKFPLFVMPTLRGCFELGTVPVHGINAVASWYIFARHIQAGKLDLTYLEPNWSLLEPLLRDDARDRFACSRQLWSDLPQTHPEFTVQLMTAIEEMEQKWPM